MSDINPDIYMQQRKNLGRLREWVSEIFKVGYSEAFAPIAKNMGWSCSAKKSCELFFVELTKRYVVFLHLFQTMLIQTGGSIRPAIAQLGGKIVGTS